MLSIYQYIDDLIRYLKGQIPDRIVSRCHKVEPAVRSVRIQSRSSSFPSRRIDERTNVCASVDIMHHKIDATK